MEEKETMKCVDKTIIAICNNIQKTINQEEDMHTSESVPETTKALAELISARAKFSYESSLF